MTYDDCLYCSTCGWHHEECWCRGGVLRDPDEQVCHRPDPDEGSIGYGRAEQPCTPASDCSVTSCAQGGLVDSPVNADTPPPGLPGCRFSDVARVFVLPEDGRR